MKGKICENKDNPVLSGIYQIFCTSNDKLYIGSSIDINYRWGKHIYLLRTECHSNIHLQNCFNKYGRESLEFSLLEDLSGHTADEIRDIEQKYLDSLDWDKALNICKDSRGGQIIEEANERRRESLREYYRSNPDALLGENNPFYGKKHSQSTKDSISRANSGKTRSEEFKKQKSEFMSNRKGAHHSEEHKSKLRDKFTGGNNPMAIETVINGIVYPTKREALKALGLKYDYQLDKLLKAERLSREGVESSDSKRMPPV